MNTLFAHIRTHWLPVSLTIGTALLILSFSPSEGSLSLASKQFWFIAGTAVATFLWLVHIIINGTIRLHKTSFWLGVLAFITSTILAALFSASPQLGFVGQGIDTGSALSILIVGILIFLTSQALQKSSWSRIFGYVILGSLTVVMLFHAIRFFSAGSFANLGVLANIFSTLIGNWTDLSIIAVAVTSALLISTGFGVTFKFTHTRTILWYVALVISVVTVLYTGFFVGYVLTGLVALISFIAHVYTHQSASRAPSISIAALLVFIACVAALIAYSPLQQLLQSVSGSRVVQTQPTISETIDISTHTLANKPIFGYGPQQWHEIWGSEMPVSAQRSIYGSQYLSSGTGYGLSTMGTQGVIGLTAFVSILVLFVWMIWERRKRLVTAPRASMYVGFSAVGLIYLTVHTPGLIPIFVTAVMIGASIAELYRGGEYFNIQLFTQSRKTLLRAGAVLVLICLSLALIFITIKNGYSFNRYKDIISTSDRGSLAEKSTNLANFHNYWGYQRLRADMYARLLFSAEDTTNEENNVQGYFSGAIESYEKTLQSNPSHTPTWYAYAQLHKQLAQEGVETAGDTYQRLLAQTLQVHKNYVPALNDMAILSIEKNDMQKALQYMQQILTQTRSYAPAYNTLAILANQEGSLEAVQAYLAQSLRINPRQPIVWFQYGVVALERDMPDEAIGAFSMTIQLQPIREAYMYLEQALRQTGRISEADTLRNQLRENGVLPSDPSEVTEAPTLQENDTDNN